MRLVRAAVVALLVVCMTSQGQADDFHCGKVFMTFSTMKDQFPNTPGGSVAVRKEQIASVRRKKDGSVIALMNPDGKGRTWWKASDPSDWDQIMRCLN